MVDKNKHTGMIPDKGLSRKSIMDQLSSFQRQDVAWEEGKTWSLVYHANDEHDELLKDVSRKYFSANYLNPFAFRGLQIMEKEVIRMTANMLHGDKDVVGTMTSGGTESILLALYTYREWARKHRPQIKQPEIVVPETIHPAHEKAAYLFGLKIRKAKTHSDQRAIPQEMESLINRNTILVCASAPSYPQGILDPIQEISQVAQKHKLPFHLDSCIGGFMLPWVEELGYPIEDWDFRVPGVTSMTADVHKFGFGAKGSSVVLYRNMRYLKHQFFVTTDWTGGMYISATLLGTRAGGPIAAAWAGMKHFGREGYLKQAKGLMEGGQKIKSLLKTIPEISIIGDPCMNIFSYTTNQNNPDLFAVAHHLEKKGWMVDRQQFPDSIHLTVLPTNLPVIDQYVTDLIDAIKFCKENPGFTGEGNAAIYGMMARIPLRGMVKRNVRQIFEKMYGNDLADQNDESPGFEITPAKKWMGWMSRFLSWWRRYFSKR